MLYLVDGHNLIPKIRGLSLSDLDDESSLIHILQTYSRSNSKAHIDVFFDKAAIGTQKLQRFGKVTAHFIPSTSNADTAIIRKLHSLGRKARNLTVVSSDRQVQAAARGSGAQILSSENFAQMIVAGIPGKEAGEAAKPEVNEGDVEHWLEIFQKKKR